MTIIKDIAWIAGVLEGEGYFGIGNGSPRIQLAMTDLDIVEKVKSIMDSTKIISSHSEIGKSNRRLRYSLTLTGNIAIQWMMTIYPFMGLRRRAKIQEVLHYWRTRYNRKQLLAQARIVKSIMELGFSKKEAEVKFLESLVKG